MSIIDTLITNRTQADVDALLALYAKPKAMWTADEWNEFLLGNHRGAYNASDMNRVLDALDYLADRVTEFGYQKPEIKRPSITEVIPGTSRLPEGYTELEYIRSTGEQYVDTEFKPNQDTRVVFTGEFPLTEDTQWLFGARISSSSAMFGFLKYKSQFRLDYGTTNNYFSNTDTVVSVDMNKNNVVVNGSEALSVTAQTFSVGHNLILFANNTSGTISGYATGTKCSGCQIYDNGILVRDYVPCLNPSNEVGLYDIVNGEFYGNAGTGYFLPGPAVTLPVGYTRLEYIESTGEQYINTDFTPNQGTRVVLDMMLTSSAAQYLFSAPLTSGKYFGVSYVGGYYAEYGSKTTKSSVTSVNTRMVIDANKANFTFGNVAVAMTASSFTSSGNMFLFADNPGEYKTSMQMYSCPIYDNDVLARLYTPCRNASGEAGLYDSITGTFFGNAGTGTFMEGAELESVVGGSTTETIIRDYYKIGDCPPVSELGQYLENVAKVRAVLALPASVPAVPEDMAAFTIEEANDIEIILTAIELLLNRISLSWFYFGEIYSGEV